MINIVLLSDKKYLYSLTVVINSIVANCKDPSDLMFHIVVDTETSKKTNSLCHILFPS